MELKRNSVARLLKKIVGFNRTFMELKLGDRDRFNSLVLGFNRTFMELKRLRLICLMSP